jgi:hypothetical protein
VRTTNYKQLVSDPRTCTTFTTYSVNFVKWSSQGMLRMSCEAMNELFQPTVNGIIQHIGECLDSGPPFSPRLGNKSPHQCLETLGVRSRIIDITWSTRCLGD